MPTISTLTVDVTARTARFRAGMRTVGIGLAAVAAGAAFAFKQFEDAEKVQAQTAAALKSTGGAANVTAGSIDRLSQSIMKKTGIDDEAIQSAENLILTFTNIRNEVGKGNKIFNRSTAAVIDMSVALGQDFKSSAIQVGKALNDPIKGITALRRVGVAFTTQQEDQIKAMVESGHTLEAQKLILAELTKEFGGSAEAQKTASGTMLTALGNLAEAIGGLIAPAVTFLADKITVLATWLTERLGPALGGVRDWLARVWERIKPVAEAFGRLLVDSLTKTWAVIQDKVWPALKRLWNALQPVLEVVGLVVGAVLVLALKALPIVAEAIAPVIDALAIMWGWFGDILTALKALGKWLAEKWAAIWSHIEEPVMAVLQPILDIVLAIVDGLKQVAEWVARLRNAPRDVIHDVSTVPSTVNPTAPFAPNDPARAIGPTFGTPQVRVFIGDEEVRRVVVRALEQEAARA